MKFRKKLFGLTAFLTIITLGLYQVKANGNNNKTTNYQIENTTELSNVGNGYTACSWANGNNIILTKKGFTGLYLYNSESNLTKTISNEMSAGYQYQQMDNGNQILTKYASFNKENSKRNEGVKVFDLNTLETKLDKKFDQSRINLAKISKQKTGAVKVSLKNKMVDVAVQSSTNASHKKAVAPGFWNKYPLVYTDEGLRLYKNNEVIKISDMYGIDAVVSPNGKLMCFNDKGILKVRDENQTETIIGEGINASWLPNSNTIVYQITKDDGQEITGSDIFLYDLNLSKNFQLTNTADVFEEYPSVSNDGKQLVFTEINTGIVYTSDLITQ